MIPDPLALHSTSLSSRNRLKIGLSCQDLFSRSVSCVLWRVDNDGFQVFHLLLLHSQTLMGQHVLARLPAAAGDRNARPWFWDSQENLHGTACPSVSSQCHQRWECRAVALGLPGKLFQWILSSSHLSAAGKAGSRFGVFCGGLELGLAKPGLWIKEVNAMLTQPCGVVSLCFSRISRQGSDKGNAPGGKVMAVINDMDVMSSSQVV